MHPHLRRHVDLRRGRRRGARLGLVTALAVPAALAALPAAAHPQGQKPVALIRAGSETSVRITWIAAADDFLILAEHLNLGPVTPAAMARQPRFREYFARRATVANGGRPCQQAILGLPPAGAGRGVDLDFECGAALSVVRIEMTLLLDISTDYFTIARARLSPTTQRRGVFSASSPAATIDFTGATVIEEPSSDGAEPQGRTGRIVAMLQGEAGSASLIVALGLAFALGALHAITPGHGKTITAAYLVGAGGNYRQALALGGVVSLTHAAAVGLLGLLAIQLDALLLPSDTGPWLEVAAGVLIIGMAFTLWRPARLHRHRHDDEKANPGLPLRRLALLGLVGGLVPSPEAIGIILVAFSLRRWGAGMLLILAFSLGLAAVVLGVALAAVRGGRLLRRFSGGRFARWAPRIAAAVFLAMGIAVTIRGALRA